MASFLQSLFTNCACPQGRMGRVMLKFMNLCHAPLTNWGLNLAGIQDGWTMLDIGCGGGEPPYNGCLNEAKEPAFMALTSLRRVWRKPKR